MTTTVVLPTSSGVVSTQPWTPPTASPSARWLSDGSRSPQSRALSTTPPRRVDAANFAAKLFVSSATEDADLFLVVRLFDPDGEEVVFKGTIDPHAPIAQGWLRASHRRLDPDRTREWRPYHPHDAAEPLTPGEVYELDIEIWPSGIVIPEGHRIQLQVRGRDYEYPPALEGDDAGIGWFPLTGCGPFLHTDQRDRPPEVFGGDVTIHTGGEHRSHLLVPEIPAG